MLGGLSIGNTRTFGPLYEINQHRQWQWELVVLVRTGSIGYKEVYRIERSTSPFLVLAR